MNFHTEYVNVLKNIHKSIKTKLKNQVFTTTLELHDFIKTELTRCVPNKNVQVIEPSICKDHIIENYVYETSGEAHLLHNFKMLKITFGLVHSGIVYIDGRTYVSGGDVSEANGSDASGGGGDALTKIRQSIVRETTQLIKDYSTLATEDIEAEEVLDTESLRRHLESQGIDFLPNTMCPITNTDEELENDRYLILNPVTVYDTNDFLVGEPNINSRIYNGDTITIRLIPMTFIKTGKYQPHLAQLTGDYTSLRLQSARETLNKVQKKGKHGVWYIPSQISTAKERLGYRECVKNDLIHEFPISVGSDIVPINVFSLTFMNGKVYLSSGDL